MKCRKLLKRLCCHLPDCCGLAGAASQEQGCCAVLTISMSEQAHLHPVAAQPTKRCCSRPFRQALVTQASLAGRLSHLPISIPY